MQENPVNLKLELCLLALLAMLWGSSYFLINIGLQTIPPITLIAIRVSVAAAFLLVVISVKKQKLPRDKSTWSKLLMQAMLNSILAWLLLAWGQQFVPSALATVLNSTSPLFVFLITVFITRHEKLSGRKMVGALIGLGGVVLIIGVDALSGIGQNVIGQLAILGGAMLYGFAAINGRRFSHLPATVVAAGTMVWAVLFLVPAAFIFENPMQLAPSLSSISAALWLGLASTGVALIIYFRLIKTIGSMGAASQAYLRSGFGVALGVFILGDVVTPLMGLGMAAAILGVVLINWPKKISPAPITP